MPLWLACICLTPFYRRETCTCPVMKDGDPVSYFFVVSICCVGWGFLGFCLLVCYKHIFPRTSNLESGCNNV